MRLVSEPFDSETATSIKKSSETFALEKIHLCFIKRKKCSVNFAMSIKCYVAEKFSHFRGSLWGMQRDNFRDDGMEYW
jgi:hypothetical protein